MPTPPVFSYYTGLVLSHSSENQTRLYTIAIREHAFLAGVMFAINANDETLTSYYTNNLPFYDVGGRQLLRLSVKFLGALKNFGLYKFVQRLGNNLVLVSMAFCACSEVEWEYTGVCDGFILNDFRLVEVYGLEKEYKPAAKRMRGDDGAPDQLSSRRCLCFSVFL